MSGINPKMTFRFPKSEPGDGLIQPTESVEESDSPFTRYIDRSVEAALVNDNTMAEPRESLRAEDTEQECSHDGIAAQVGNISETDQIERWIREADHKPLSYSFSSSVADPAGESLSDQGELLWQGVHTRTRRPSLWKVIASVAGAVATGAVFGFLALSLFKGEVTMPNPEASIPTLSNGTSTQGAAVKAGSTSAGGGEGKKNTVAAANQPAADQGAAQHAATTAGGVYVTEVNIPEKVFYMLQYGVFDQPEGAKKAASELRELGLAAMEEQSSQHRVYAAIAQAKEDAMGLSQLMKNNQVDLYVREMTRPALAKLAFQGGAATVEQFIAQSDKVNDWLMSQSIAYLEKSEVKGFDGDATEQLRQEHLKWTQQMNGMQKGQPEQSLKAWTQLVQAMNTAISAVNEYNKQPAASHLWSVQEAVMIYRTAESNWLDTMKA
ncbi:SPOR domain-containing protein [Paenibacillus profundus]|uniref:SPOR domain-containing protein n=1 Tax=Paenibacillus profundus TaxID=1173085 RepID=A0ABS8YE14_9BACL|nr:SPOR domain-containing protein [Paenibacillus profundus]MCE5170240.1 SPOR domain-containing protein [Paenibacillus profundus]